MTIQERNTLINKHMPLARKMAWNKLKSCNKSISYDELESAACFGLVDAATKYDNNKSCSFHTFAKCRIVGAILDHVREERKHPMSSLDEMIENKDDFIENKQIGFRVDELLEELNDTDRKIFYLYHIENHSMKEIGVKFGLTESRVSQLLSGSMQLLRSIN